MDRQPFPPAPATMQLPDPTSLENYYCTIECWFTGQPPTARVIYDGNDSYHAYEWVEEASSFRLVEVTEFLPEDARPCFPGQHERRPKDPNAPVANLSKKQRQIILAALYHHLVDCAGAGADPQDLIDLIDEWLKSPQKAEVAITYHGL